MGLRWKRGERPKGLASVCAGLTGSKLWDGETTFARTNHSDKRWSTRRGWYWVTYSDSLEHMNTCDNPLDTEDEAKKAAMKYVKENLA